MAKIRLEAEGKREVLAYLEALLGRVQILQTSVGAVVADIAAMRDCLFDDPEETTLNKSQQKLVARNGMTTVAGTIGSYDDLIEEISSSPQYKN